VPSSAWHPGSSSLASRSDLPSPLKGTPSAPHYQHWTAFRCEWNASSSGQTSGTTSGSQDLGPVASPVRISTSASSPWPPKQPRAPLLAAAPQRTTLQLRGPPRSSTNTPQLDRQRETGQTPTRRLPLSTMVLSLGGMIERDARGSLKSWKTALAGGVYSVPVRRLSLGLLRPESTALSHKRRSKYIRVP
jgi:hypothetical protein